MGNTLRTATAFGCLIWATVVAARATTSGLA